MPIDKAVLTEFCDRTIALQKTNCIPDLILSIIHPAGNIEITSGFNTHHQTIFPLGSLSKAFAATAIGTIVDLNLNSAVQTDYEGLLH